MNYIEKNIFDALARRKGINLPGVGSLSVVHIPAEFITDSSMRPPQNKIIFSSSLNPQYVSAGELKGYEEWLQHTVQGRGIREINGVGVLKGNIFYPSVELHDILNPHGAQPVALKPHYGLKKKIAVGIGVVAAAAAVIFAVVLIDRFAGDKTRAEERMPGTAEIVVEERREASARGESTIAATVAQEVAHEAAYHEGAVTPPTGNAAVTEGQSPTPDIGECVDEGVSETEEYLPTATPDPRTVVSLPEQKTYYLVAGVFSEPENADRLISRDPLGISSVNYKKIEFGNGKVLVSAFSSPDREKVEKRRRELSSVNSDLWIYGKK